MTMLGRLACLCVAMAAPIGAVSAAPPVASSVSAGDTVVILQNGRPAQATAAQIAALGGGSSGGVASSYPAGSAFSGSEAIAGAVGSTAFKYTPGQFSAYTLNSGVSSLTAASSVSASDIVPCVQSGTAKSCTTAQIAAIASPPLNLTISSRDSQGRVATYTSAGATYTVSYDAFGPSTIVGGGRTVTVSRDAAGNVTSMVTS